MKRKRRNIYKDNESPEAGLFSSISGFIRSILNQSNSENTEKLLTEQASLEFESVYGVEIEKLQLEIQNLEDRFKKSANELNKLEAKKEKIRPYKRTEAPKGKNYKTPFSEWSSKDQVSFLLSLGFMLILLGTGTGNVYANILSSGNPVFIENHFLALLLSALFPASTFTLKFLRDLMEEDRSQKAYTLFIYTLTVASIFHWAYQFSIYFPGMSNEIDLDSLGETSGSGSIMVQAQLLSELLVSVSLYISASDISGRYFPDCRVRNPEHIEILDVLKTHLDEHDKLCTERNDKRGRWTELNARRLAYINKVLAKYMSLKARQSKASLNSELNSL